MSDYATALKIAIGNASRQILIYSECLAPAFWNNSECRDTLSQFLTASRHSHCRIVIRDTRPLLQCDHLIMHLARRLSSHIEIRVLPTSHPFDPNIEFVLNDCGQMLYKPNWQNADYIERDIEAPQTRQCMRQFPDIWETAKSDVNLRELRI